MALIERHLLSQLDANSDMVLEADKYGNTLLFRLVYHSYWLFIPSLIDRGADVDHRNHKGERPIHRSLYKWHGNSDRLTTGILLSRGAAYDIWVASGLGETHDVYRMLKADPNLANFHNGAQHMPGGTSFPLAIAVREGHIDVVRLLLAHGAAPNAENVIDGFEEWGAPLVLAVTNGYFEIAHLLLDYGANPNTMIEAASSAVDYACYSDNADFANRMVVEGGRLGMWAHIQTHNYPAIGKILNRCPKHSGDRVEDSIDDNFLGNAAWQGEPNVVRMCLQRKPEISRSHGMRLLHNTLNSHNRDGDWKDYASVIQQLLEYGVNPNTLHPERTGTPLHWLSDEYFQNRQNEAEMIELAKIFLEYGTDINAKDRETNSTALAWTARYGHEKFLAFLLEQGASPALPDDEPETTPLFWAETQGYTSIASVLRQSLASQ